MSGADLNPNGTWGKIQQHNIGINYSTGEIKRDAQGRSQFEIDNGRAWNGSGEDQAITIAALNKQTPDWRTTPTGTPMAGSLSQAKKESKVTGASTSSAQSVSQAAPTNDQASVGSMDTTTRRSTGQVGSVIGLLSTIQKSLLGM